MSDDRTILSMHSGYDTDGVYTDGFLARPAQGTGLPGVVLLSGMGGMTWTQREITRRYARAGFVALSPDYMGGALDSHAARLHAKNALDVDSAVAAIIHPLPAPPAVPQGATQGAPAPADAALSGRMRPGLFYGASDDRRPAGLAAGP